MRVRRKAYTGASSNPFGCEFCLSFGTLSRRSFQVPTSKQSGIAQEALRKFPTSPLGKLVQGKKLWLPLEILGGPAYRELKALDLGYNKLGDGFVTAFVALLDEGGLAGVEALALSGTVNPRDRPAHRGEH